MRGRGEARPDAARLAAVASFVVLLAVPFAGKAWHVDEPFFLAIARHILADPLHPLAFSYNWYGVSAPMARLNNTPPLLPYLLAAALKLTGGAEAPTRLLFLPFDLAAGLSLYLLAARYLRKPLLPTLLVLASPAYMIDMNHLMAEKVMAGFAFPCLYFLAAGEDAAAAACFALALLSKYNAVFLAGPALVLLGGRLPPRRVAAWFAAAGAPVACWLLWNGGAAWGAAAAVTGAAARMWWATPAHKLRSFLAFTGGCSAAAAAWPLLLRPSRGALAACAAASAVLFLPALDLAPVVRPADRAAGFAFSACALLALRALVLSRRPGARLWLAWAASTASLLLFAYWSVLARLVLFLVPPLVFALAEELEDRPALYGASLAATAALSVALSHVDRVHADAQREIVRAAAPARGRLWSAGHWGLQHYVEAAGGAELDAAAGGWDAVKPGDAAIVPRVNSNVARPSRPLRARVRSAVVTSAVPLRLMSGWTGEGGFYSNAFGFLPYSPGTEPVEEFTVVEPL